MNWLTFAGICSGMTIFLPKRALSIWLILAVIATLTALSAMPIRAETIVGKIKTSTVSLHYPEKATFKTTLPTDPIDLIRLHLYFVLPSKDESNKLEAILTGPGGIEYVFSEQDRDPEIYGNTAYRHVIDIKRDIPLPKKSRPGEWRLMFRPLGDYSEKNEDLFSPRSQNRIEFIHDPFTVKAIIPESSSGNPQKYSQNNDFTVEFSKPAAGFAKGDINWTGPKGSGISKVSTNDSKSFSVQYAWPADTDGKATILIPAGVAQDDAGRSNTASEEYVLYLDSKAPKVTLSSTVSGTSSAETFPVTATFSETVTDFTLSDISVTNGTVAELTDNGNNSYSFDLIPEKDGEVIVSVAAASVTDSASNSNKISNRVRIISDRSPPVITGITSTETGPSKAARIPVTVTFSEEVMGFDDADLAVTGAQIDNFTDVNNTAFTFDLLPPKGGNGHARVNIGNEVATDPANLRNKSGASFSIAYDRSAPAVTITSDKSNPTNAVKIPVTVTFTEDVTGFTAEDLVVPDGQVAAFTGSGKDYSFELFPSGDGRITVDIPANAASDVAKNGSRKAARFSIAHDSTAPGVVISSSETSPSNAAVIPVTVRFSEPVRGFATGDLQLSAEARAAKFMDQGKGVFTFDLIPSKGYSGPLTVDIAAQLARDEAGNGNAAAAQFSVESDRVAPKPAISSIETGPTRAARIPVKVTFPEKVTGFTQADVAHSEGFTLRGFTNADGIEFGFWLIPPDGQSGTLTVDIPAGAAVDMGGNHSLKAGFSIAYDRTAANVTLSSSEADPTNAKTFRVRAVFTDEVKDFDQADLIVDGAKADGFTGSEKEYSFNLIPSGDGDITVDILEGAATDDFGVATKAAHFSITHDGTASTAEIGATIGKGPVNVSLTEIPIAFAEPVTGLSGDDLQITGAKLVGLSGEGKAYRLRLEPNSEDQAITIALSPGAAMDSAGNGSLAAKFLVQHDGLIPAVIVSSTVEGPSNVARIPVTVTFSEEVTGFTPDRLVVTGAAVQGFSGSGKYYRFTLIPDDGFAGRITVDIAAGAAHDAAGNPSAAARQLAFDYATSELGAEMTSPHNRLTNANRISVTVTFTDPVSDFASEDLTVTGARIENFSGSDRSYSFDLIPAQDGAITVDIEDGKVTDLFGNSNHAVETFSIIYDGTAPAATMTSPENGMTVLARIPVMVSFTEPVAGFDAGKMQVSGARMERFSGAGKTYRFELVPPVGREGQINLRIPVGAVRDRAGNETRTAVEFLIDYDISAPAVTISTSAAPQDSQTDIPVDVRFSAAVDDFDESDLQVSGARVSQFSGKGAEYSLVLIASGKPVITVDIAGGAAHDRAGNGNTAAQQFSYNFDIERPSVTLSGTPDFPGRPYRLAVTFSEPVTGLEPGDFKLVNADIAELSGSGTDYSLQVTARKFAHSVQLRENTAMDAAGNGNTVSNLFANRSDGTGPSPRITGLPGSFLPGDSYEVGFDFGEPVAGFGLDDILVVNGTVTGMSGGPRHYRATVKPDGKGNLSVSLPQSAARDRSGQASLAASARSRIDSEKIASKAVTGFMKTRVRNVIQHQPSLTDLLRPRKRRLDFDARLNGRRQKFNFVAETEDLVWARLTGSRTKEKRNGDTDYTHGVIGSRILLNNDLLGGLMLQLDHTEMVTSDGVMIGGSGCLVGPYFVGKHADHPIYYQGSILYGQTRNHVSPLGTYTDEFKGDRWLATLGVEGDYPVEHLMLQPRIFVSHAHEAQRSYTDDLSNPVPAQSVSMTEVDLGLEVEGLVWKRNDNWTHMAGISGIWAKHTGSGVATTYLQGKEGGRVRIDGGLRYDDGKRLAGSIKASVDGVARDTVTYTVGADIAFRF